MQSTQVIVRLKGIKKRKAIKSSHKEVSDKDNNGENQDVSYKKTLVKRLREKAEFAINQLETAMSGQKEVIEHSLNYIRKACGKSIENSIQQQMNALQSQTNKKLETILQIVQQNARNIEKEINSKQMMRKAQTSQTKQSSQTTQDKQMTQRSASKLTYAQKAAQSADANIKANANAKASEWNLVVKKPSPKSQEILYRERRLIVTSKNENWILQAMKMRNAVNNALKKAKSDIIVATVAKTQRDNNIALTISEKYIAKALLKQRDIWEHIFEVKSIKKNEKWYKIVIHSLKINIFNMKIEMKYLRIELEKYNSELKLIINSI